MRSGVLRPSPVVNVCGGATVPRQGDLRACLVVAHAAVEDAVRPAEDRSAAERLNGDRIIVSARQSSSLSWEARAMARVSA